MRDMLDQWAESSIGSKENCVVCVDFLGVDSVGVGFGFVDLGVVGFLGVDVDRTNFVVVDLVVVGFVSVDFGWY